jgi:hypothetical protein
MAMSLPTGYRSTFSNLPVASNWYIFFPESEKSGSIGQENHSASLRCVRFPQQLVGAAP